MVLNFELALPPRALRATMQTTAMRARRRAYSTRAAPRSVLPKRARRYGAKVRKMSMLLLLGFGAPVDRGVACKRCIGHRAGDLMGNSAHFGTQCLDFSFRREKKKG